MWSRKRRLISSGISVVIGVAFLAATMVLGDAMSAGVKSLFTEGNATTDALVRNSTELGTGEVVERGTLPASLVGSLADEPGVLAAAGIVDGVAQINGSDGKPVGGDGPPTIGTTWIDDPRLQSFEIADGRAPVGANEVVIDRGTADKAHLHVGDRTTVRVPAVIPVTVVGIAQLPSGASMGGVTFTFFAADEAASILYGNADIVTSVALAGEPGWSQDRLRDAVAATLPTEAEALTGTQLTTEQTSDIEDDFLGFMRTFLMIFAGVALVVATFSIHNTFSILVAQRTRESALMRALGASKRQILGSVLAEGALVGIVSAGVGLGAGIGLAHGLDALLDSLGFGIPTGSLTASTSTIVTTLVVGSVVTLVASVAPSIKAGRVAPLAALRDVSVDRSSASKWRMVIGLLLTAAGFGVAFGATSQPDSAVPLAGLGAAIALVGMVVLGPVVARFAASVLGAPAAVFRRRTGGLARRNAMRNPRRTAGTASALMIGTAVVAVFATFGSSMKASLDDVIRSSFGGDLVVSQQQASGSALDAALAPAIAALPEVKTVATIGNAAVRLDGRSEDPAVIDPTAMDAVVDMGVRQGSLDGMADDAIAISTKYATTNRLDLGTAVTMQFVDGSSQTVHVGAIYEERNIIGDILITDALWAPHAIHSGDVAVLIDLRDGVSVADGRAAVAAVAERFGAPKPQDRSEFVDSASEGADQMLTLVYGLLGLAIVIALLGIANTLSLSIHERTRELGVMRAVGQTRGQLRATVRWESVIIAVFGTVGGLALGTTLGWGLMRAMKAQAQIGVFDPPITTLAVVLGVAVVAGVVAALRPARRAAKLDVLAAIASA